MAAEPIRQHRICQIIRITFLCHQEFVAQILGRKSSVEKGRLQHRVTGEVAFDARGIDAAFGLTLQIAVAANVVGIGMSIVDGGQAPSIGVQQLPHLTPGIFIVAAVDQAYIRIVQLHQSHFGGTLDIVAAALDMIQFVHKHTSLPCFLLSFIYRQRTVVNK